MPADPRTEGDAEEGEPRGLLWEERRWLHDKYQRLAEHEAQLADYRTSYFGAILAALVAAQALIVINLRGAPNELVTSSTILDASGIAISAVWALVLHRTYAAQALWREALIQLEVHASPLPGRLDAVVSIRGGPATIAVDLARPYHTHRDRFSARPNVPWLDRVRPLELTSDIPLILVGIWAVTLAIVWAWFVFGLR